MATELFAFSSTDLYQIWLAITAEAPGTGNATAANQLIQINQLNESSTQLSVFKDDTTHESVFKDDAGQGLFLSHSSEVSVFMDTSGNSVFNDDITTYSVFKNSAGHSVFIDPEDGTVWFSKINDGIQALTDPETGNPYLLEVLDKLTPTNVQPSVFKDIAHGSVFTDYLGGSVFFDAFNQSNFSDNDIHSVFKDASGGSAFLTPDKNSVFYNIDDGAPYLSDILFQVTESALDLDLLQSRSASVNLTVVSPVTAASRTALATAIAADIAAHNTLHVFDIMPVPEIAAATYSAIITYSNI